MVVSKQPQVEVQSLPCTVFLAFTDPSWLVRITVVVASWLREYPLTVKGSPILPPPLRLHDDGVAYPGRERGFQRITRRLEVHHDAGRIREFEQPVAEVSPREDIDEHTLFRRPDHVEAL